MADEWNGICGNKYHADDGVKFADMTTDELEGRIIRGFSVNDTESAARNHDASGALEEMKRRAMRPVLKLSPAERKARMSARASWIDDKAAEARKVREEGEAARLRGDPITAKAKFKEAEEIAMSAPPLTLLLEDDEMEAA